MPAQEFPYRQLDEDRTCAPREVHEVALIAAMDQGCRHGTTQAARRRGHARQLRRHHGGNTLKSQDYREGLRVLPLKPMECDIFTERLPNLVAAYAQKTSRLVTVLQAI